MPPAASVSLTLAPHSRLRMEVRLGRVGTLNQALLDDPQLFSRIIKNEYGERRAGDFLLMEAILSCPKPSNLAVVAYLLSRGASTPASFPGAMYFAMSNNDTAVVELLEKSGWTPDLCDEHGKTALSSAAQQALTEQVKKWRKFLPLPPDANGNNLLHDLCGAGLWAGGAESVVSTAEVLIRGNTDWQQTNNENKTPAHLCGYPQIVEEINALWRKHRSIQNRKALNKIAARVRGKPQDPSPASPKM